jgi:ABC-2 type transport system ATP-binding protein
MFQVNGLQFVAGLNGVVGPKGVGKTRLLRKLSQMNGTASREGREFSCNAYYLNSDWNASQDMTVLEYLTEAAKDRANPSDDVLHKVQAALDRVLLKRYADHRLDELSTALQRRVRLAEAVLADAELLLLDDLLNGLEEPERINLGHTLCELAKEHIVVLASDVEETPEGLLDTVCLLHPDKGAVTVSAHTAYEWVEGKVWEYVTPELPSPREDRIVSKYKRCEDAVYVREVAAEVPHEEVSQVTPTLIDAYAWWVKQG